MLIFRTEYRTCWLSTLPDSSSACPNQFWSKCLVQMRADDCLVNCLYKGTYLGYALLSSLRSKKLITATVKLRQPRARSHLSCTKSARCPPPLKLRPYGGIEMCVLLLMQPSGKIPYHLFDFLYFYCLWATFFMIIMLVILTILMGSVSSAT